MNNLLEIRDLVVKRGGVTVLEVAHLDIPKGQVLAIIGPNGAGKSTLLLTLARLLKPERGSILFDGRQVETENETAYRRRIGLVMQNPLLLDQSVFDNIALGLKFRGTAHEEKLRRVNTWMEKLQIAQHEKHKASKLSGGEAQRVALARAFVLEPELLLLDEPFSALDTTTRNNLLTDLRTLLAETGVTTVFITHNLEEARQLAQYVAVLDGGRLSDHGKMEDVLRGIATYPPSPLMTPAFL